MLSDLKEAFDVTTGRNTPEESAEDQEANKYGREGAKENPGEPCANICAMRYPEKRREKKGT